MKTCIVYKCMNLKVLLTLVFQSRSNLGHKNWTLHKSLSLRCTEFYSTDIFLCSWMASCMAWNASLQIFITSHLVFFRYIVQVPSSSSCSSLPDKWCYQHLWIVLLLLVSNLCNRYHMCVSWLQNDLTFLNPCRVFVGQSPGSNRAGFSPESHTFFTWMTAT